jgi:hypothetical protein
MLQSRPPPQQNDGVTVFNGPTPLNCRGHSGCLQFFSSSISSYRMLLCLPRKQACFCFQKYFQPYLTLHGIATSLSPCLFCEHLPTRTNSWCIKEYSYARLTTYGPWEGQDNGSLVFSLFPREGLAGGESKYSRLQRLAGVTLHRPEARAC